MDIEPDKADTAPRFKTSEILRYMGIAYSIAKESVESGEAVATMIVQVNDKGENILYWQGDKTDPAFYSIEHHEDICALTLQLHFGKEFLLYAACL
jgi:hypothetical protein